MAREKKTGIRARPMESRPKLKRSDLPYREAFMILSSSRTQGMGGFDPLRISEIMSLVCTGGIAFNFDRPKYLRVMQLLDRVFLDYHAEKAKKSKP